MMFTDLIQTAPTFAQNFAGDVRGWLSGQAASLKLHLLLAHADDGVIWGKYDAATTKLIVGNDVAPTVSPPLRLKTLQQCRLFGEQGELFLWKAEDDWKARYLLEPTAPNWDKDAEPIDEAQVMWGTVAESCKQGFTLLTEAKQNGLRHVVPIPSDQLNEDVLTRRRLRLTVRHYLDFDNATGEARIALSRLVSLAVTSPRTSEGGNHAR